jgi:nickel/cobalt exporter
MSIIAFSAAFVGIVHSLSPSHWLPVVLMAKARRWPLRKAMLGAAVTASGHIFLSLALGVLSIFIGAHFLAQYETEIERYAGLGLSAFGLIYAGMAFFRHSACHGHTHHGPDPKGQRAPYVFLFTLGFSPCVAVLPVFATAATEGTMATVLSLLAFSFGVLLSLVGSTVLVSRGIIKLDHPIFEHYGDVITGLGVAVMGVILFFTAH